MSPNATAAERGGTLTRGQVLSYSLGDVANNLSFMMTSMFLSVYMTDIAGVSAGVAGAIYGITKIWAGMADLIAGNTVDRANTRWGRLRPWLIWSSTPLAIVFVLLFSVPAGLSPTMTVAWIFIADALFQLAYSFTNIPYGSLSAAMTQDATDRSRLSGARSIASAVTGVALSAVVAPQFQDTSGDDVRLKFTITTLLLALVALVLYFICFKNTREVVPRSPGKIKLSNTLKMVGKNKPLLVLITGALFMLGSMFTMMAVGVYYTRLVLGNAGWYTLLMLAQTVGTIIVASALPKMTVAFGKRMTYIYSTLVAVAAFVLIFFIPAGSLPIALLAWFLYGLGTGGTNSAMFSMQADTVDYGEWKTGIRSEGGSYSILSFVRKCGQGFGGWFGLALIGWFGYSSLPGAAQPESAVFGIRVACGLVPAAFALVAAAIMFMYPLKETAHAELVRELNQRRTRSAAGTAMGVDTGSLQVVDVGDGRTMRVNPSEGRPIVTLFEREGAGGTEIGPRLAEALGVPFTGQRFSSDELAATDHTDIQTETGMTKFLRAVSYTGTQDSDLAQAAELSDRNQIAVENTAEVLAAVENGGVVMGRNATFILSEAVGAFHVKLTAPIDKRIERVMHKTGLDAATARHRIRDEEELRARMSRRLYHYDPFNDEYYDLVINTGSVTYEQVVEMIVTMYRSKYGTPGTGARRAGRAAEDRPGDLPGGDRPDGPRR